MSGVAVGGGGESFDLGCVGGLVELDAAANIGLVHLADELLC